MHHARQIQIASLRAKIERIGLGAARPRRDFPPESRQPLRAGASLLMPDGLAAACIHEIEGAGWDAETGAAASGFAAAMLARCGQGAILWAVRQDAPFAPRLAAFGLDPGRLILCQCRNDAEILAALEDALRTPGVTAALGEVERISLTQSRRLHLICAASGATGLLLRRAFHGRRAQRREGSAAATRWRIHFAPTDAAGPGLGAPRWRLDLTYRRGGMPASYLVEWDDEARHLHLVAQLADHEADTHQPGLRRAG